MTIFEKITASLAGFLKYAPFALAAVQGAETAIGPGGGSTKKQIAVAAILSVVHAGEAVPVPQVQVISAVVDIIVSTLNAAGALGKPAPPTVPVAAAVADNKAA